MGHKAGGGRGARWEMPGPGGLEKKLRNEMALGGRGDKLLFCIHS